MSPRLAFRKTTPDGLSIDIEEFEGRRFLLLTKDAPGSEGRPAQILGVAGAEINTATITWYYEYEMLPRDVSRARLWSFLESLGYKVGVFDQFANFQSKVA